MVIKLVDFFRVISSSSGALMDCVEDDSEDNRDDPRRRWVDDM